MINFTEWLKNRIPKKILGKTNYPVTIISLGGQGSLESNNKNEEKSIEIIHEALKLGINYFDTSPIYGDSEKFLGKALEKSRDGIFIATKTDKRDYDGSMKLIEKSLKRLKTDYIDLWQLHHVNNQEDIDLLNKSNSAIKALNKMKEEKVVRNIGITGHEDPKIILSMIRKYDFDSILMPINPGDYVMESSFIKDVIPIANKKNMGIIGMKVFAQNGVFVSKNKNPKPFIEYALSQNIHNIIIGIDEIKQLKENIKIAIEFKNIDKKTKSNIEKEAKENLNRYCFFRKEFGGYQSKFW